LLPPSGQFDRKRNWPGNEKGNTRNLSTKARMKSFYRMSGGTTNVFKQKKHARRKKKRKGLKRN